MRQTLRFLSLLLISPVVATASRLPRATSLDPSLILLNGTSDSTTLQDDAFYLNCQRAIILLPRSDVRGISLPTRFSREIIGPYRLPRLERIVDCTVLVALKPESNEDWSSWSDIQAAFADMLEDAHQHGKRSASMSMGRLGAIKLGFFDVAPIDSKTKSFK